MLCLAVLRSGIGLRGKGKIVPSRPISRRNGSVGLAQRVLRILFFVYLLWPGSGAAAKPAADSSENVEPVYHIWRKDQFRIIYTTTGEDAVPATDVNGNAVPDFVEDIASQFVLSHHVLCVIAGFPDPLQSPRYPGVVFVDVYIQNKSKHDGHTGVAMRSSYRAFQAGDSNTRALKIALANDFDPKKYCTPTHEYFHLIQNSVTYIANGWFFEGTARWAIDAIVEKKPDKNASLDKVHYYLTDPAGQKTLQKSMYKGAAYLWIPLADICPRATVHLPENDPVLRITYVDGSPTLKDHTFAGALLVKRVLELTAERQHIPFTKYNYGEWDKVNRIDERNNPYLFSAVEEAIKEFCE